MANVITNPSWIKAKPHASAEKQVGDSDPSSRTDVINRPAKGIVSVMTKLLETFFISGTFDFTGTTSTSAYTGLAIVPCAGSTDTPAQHGLYRENVPKAWARVWLSSGEPSITNSFNVASITDNGAGDFTLEWDRDFADGNYVFSGADTTGANTTFGGVTLTTGTMRYQTFRGSDAAAQDRSHCILAMGDQ